MKNKNLALLIIIVVIGLFGAGLLSLSHTVYVPSIDELESVSIYPHRVLINQHVSGGIAGQVQWMPLIKIIESDEAGANYYYMYDLDSRKQTIFPEDKIDALIYKNGDAAAKRFIWQLSKNGKVILSYKDVVAAEDKRKKTMKMLGISVAVASLLLYLMLRYSKE
jgi:hypothetical protein